MLRPSSRGPRGQRAQWLPLEVPAAVLTKLAARPWGRWPGLPTGAGGLARPRPRGPAATRSCPAGRHRCPSRWELSGQAPRPSQPQGHRLACWRGYPGLWAAGSGQCPEGVLAPPRPLWMPQAHPAPPCQPDLKPLSSSTGLSRSRSCPAATSLGSALLWLAWTPGEALRAGQDHLRKPGEWPASPTGSLRLRAAGLALTAQGHLLAALGSPSGGHLQATAPGVVQPEAGATPARCWQAYLMALPLRPWAAHSARLPWAVPCPECPKGLQVAAPGRSLAPATPCVICVFVGCGSGGTFPGLEDCGALALSHPAVRPAPCSPRKRLECPQPGGGSVVRPAACSVERPWEGGTPSPSHARWAPALEDSGEDTHRRPGLCVHMACGPPKRLVPGLKAQMACARHSAPEPPHSCAKGRVAAGRSQEPRGHTAA